MKKCSPRRKLHFDLEINQDAHELRFLRDFSVNRVQLNHSSRVCNNESVLTRSYTRTHGKKTTIYTICMHVELDNRII
jgi:hypothetical protein